MADERIGEAVPELLQAEDSAAAVIAELVFTSPDNRGAIEFARVEHRRSTWFTSVNKIERVQYGKRPGRAEHEYESVSVAAAQDISKEVAATIDRQAGAREASRLAAVESVEDAFRPSSGAGHKLIHHTTAIRRVTGQFSAGCGGPVKIAGIIEGDR